MIRYVYMWLLVLVSAVNDVDLINSCLISLVLYILSEKKEDCSYSKKKSDLTRVELNHAPPLDAAMFEIGI